MKVVYIMGAGHIGSTVLDIVLGSHAQVESLGEISKFHRYGWTLDENRKCSCGVAVYACPFWAQIRKLWSDLTGNQDGKKFLELQERYELSAAGWLWLLWNGIRPSNEYRAYLRGTEALIQAVQEVSGKHLMVDSSLTPRRAFLLSKIPNIDLHLIHMVRDGRGVIWSLKKPGKQTLTKAYVPAPAWRTAQYWISANLQSLWVFNRLKASRRLLVRYEDFVSDPSKTVTGIGQWVDEDFSALFTGADLSNPNQERHTVGGNRVRMQKDIRIKADFAWLEHLPTPDRKLFWQLAGWLARKFGYLEHPTTAKYAE